MSVLNAKNITKDFVYYKRTGLFSREKKVFRALDEFSLEIPKPMIYGLVGPNGAGKTTFIKHCLGLTERTSGEISVLGYNPHKKNRDFRKKIGFISGQKQSLSQDVSAYDSLKYSGYLYDLTTQRINKRIEYLINLFNVQEKIDVPVRQLSLGQRMKFEIISSVLHEPELLCMDEPTLGLDFEAQHTMRSLLREIHEQDNISILLTSHYIPDISTLCEKVAVIDKGKKVFDGKLSEITKNNSNPYLNLLVQELNTHS